VEVKIHAFLISTLYGVEQPDLSSTNFILVETPVKAGRVGSMDMAANI
jgi:hypothetical protein